MSVNMVKLAADLSSFNNISVEDSLNALRSGLSGETEPLKRFGIALNETTLKNKAFAMGFGEIKGVMDPAIKAQVTYALVMEQTTLAQGDYARTASGTANTMKTLTAKFQDAKVAIGNALMPAFRALLAVLDLLIPVLEAIGKFWTDNADAIKMYMAIVLTGVTAFYAVRTAIVVTKTVMIAYTAVTKAMAAGHTLASIAAFNLKTAMFILNGVIRANPVGLIVTAIMALGAAFIYAWKHSETFRGVVIKVAQAVAGAFAKVIEILGKFFGMLGKVPGMGWAKGVASGLDDISTKIETASGKLSSLKSNLQGSSVSGASIHFKTTDSTVSKVTGPTAAEIKAAADAVKKRLADIAAQNKTVVKIYADMNKSIADGEQKAADALVKRDKAVLDTKKKYADLEVKITEKKNADLKKNEDDWNSAYEKAYASNKKTLEKIDADYYKKKTDIEKAYTEKKASLELKATEDIAAAQITATEKQISIVQQSMDKLRSAFATGTGANISEIFKAGATSAEQVIKALKAKLLGVRTLQENAGKLAGAGYSQSFIEQVVANGPETGNQMADALLGASKESQAQMQDLFAQVNSVSAYGLDQLATTMNAGGNLATEELTKAYNQVPIDLAKTIANINELMIKDLASVNKDYLASLADASTIRDEAIAEANQTLLEALADSDKAFAEANKATMDDFNQAIKDNAAALAEALAQVQLDYEDAIATIIEDTKARLAELTSSLKEAAAALVALGAAKTAAAAISNAPVYTPVVPVSASSGSGSGSNIGGNQGGSNSSLPYNYNQGAGSGIIINAPITNNNTTTPVDMGETIVRIVKFGLVVL